MTDNTDNLIHTSEEINEFGEVNGIESLNNEPVIVESEPIPNPWDNAPENVLFYSEIIDGKLESFTTNPEKAYRKGWLDNQIPLSDVEFSDIDDWPYLKDKCPHKTQEMIDRENAIREIATLKQALSDTDYKAIKYAEGQISESEYAPVRELRQGYRDRINELEALL